MALKIDNKFLATPSFVVRSNQGQNLTIAINPRQQGGNYVGWYDAIFDPSLAILAEDGINANGISSVSPSVSGLPTIRNTSGITGDQMAVYQFLNWLALNPCHISRLNFRCSAMAYIPTQLTVCTPNLFSGQLDKQVVNVTADANMYQNQTNIITVDCNIFLTRNSWIEFNGAFSTAAQPTLSIDLKIDAYMSIEKAFIENINLLETASGQAALLQNAMAEVDANTNSNDVADSAVQAVNKPFGVNVSKFGTSSNSSGIDYKSFNSRGNR